MRNCPNVAHHWKLEKFRKGFFDLKNIKTYDWTQISPFCIRLRTHNFNIILQNKKKLEFTKDSNFLLVSISFMEIKSSKQLFAFWKRNLNDELFLFLLAIWSFFIISWISEMEQIECEMSMDSSNLLMFLAKFEANIRNFDLSW